MEDEKIVSLYWQRNEEAIKETEEKYDRYLTKIAYNILSNHEDSRESVNDTYLAVWNSIPPNKPEFLFAYTAKICRNLALNRVEWEGAAKRNAVVVELSEELSQCIPDSSATVEQTELAQVIAAFLKALPEEKRSLFVRRYWYGESIRELAEAFHCREGKVKSILFRLRNQLWNELRK